MESHPQKCVVTSQLGSQHREHRPRPRQEHRICDEPSGAAKQPTSLFTQDTCDRYRSIGMLLLGIVFVAITCATPLTAQVIDECSSPALSFGSAATMISDTISIGPSIVIQDVNVGIDITHSFIGDITIDVISPAGTSVRLHDEGGLTADLILLTFDDQGITNGSDLYECDCAMQPSGAGELFDFVGSDSAGTWTLDVVDVFPASDDGELNSWCLQISDAAPLNSVSTLVCTPNPLDLTAALTWSNGSVYDAIDVCVEGVVVSTLAGDATATTVPAVDFPGYADVCVIGRLGAEAANPSCCLVEFRGTPNLEECSTTSESITDTMLLESPIVVSSTAMVTFLEVSVDITHAFIGDLEIELVSPAATGVQLHLQDGFAETEIVLTYNDNGLVNGPPYGCACLKRPSGPSMLSDTQGEPIGGVWSLEVADLFSGDDGTLNSWCVRFFSGGVPFIRGDVDNDGAFVGLLDAVYALNFQFVAGSPAPACMEAADVDNDGVFIGLLDALYILNTQFVAGSPVPPAPFPDCGFDDDNALGCATPICP